MAAPAQVDSNTGFAAGGVQTLAATIDWTPTSGNLLMFAAGGDKDLGTFTMSGWNVPVDLRSSSVSLIMAWKVSDGTETVASGTCTGANSGGSNTWVAEYSQSGSGAWGLRATKGENNSDENNVTVWSSGTTGTTDFEGKAIAAWATDSVTGAGTPTYTNGFSQIRVTTTGSGQAGLWVASADATASNTYESEIDRVGGTADQMSGAILVMGREDDSGSPQNVAPSSIASGEAIGSVTVARASILTPGGIASAAAFGTHLVITTQDIAPSGISSAEGFGDHTLSSGITLAPFGVASGEAFGATVAHLAPVLIQGSNDFIPGGTTLIDHQLSGQLADPGNLLVYVLSGDKNIGTLTLDGSGWQYPVNLRSTSLSLAIAWKIAQGGESGVTGSFTSGNPGGSNSYLAEFQATGVPGYWVVKGTATGNTTEANVTSVSTGTTSASAGDGFALAAFGVDSFKGDTDDAYSNGFSNLFAQSSGDAEAGLWVARKGAVAGATYESTLTRSQLIAPVVPDQMSGGLVIFGVAETQTVTPVGIESSETFGTTTVRGPIGPTGIVTAEAFGTALVDPGSALVTVTGIASSETFGEHILSFGFVIQAEGIATGEAFGTHELTEGVRLMYVAAANPDGVFLGGVEVAAIYAGSTLVW